MKTAASLTLSLIAVSAWASEISDWRDPSTGLVWHYQLEDGRAILCSGFDFPTIPTSTKGDLSIPAFLDGYRVMGVGARAFYRCSGLTSVTIPSGVESISTSAFADCSSMTSIVIPPTVMTIGSSAFSDCSRLISVSIPVGVTRIAEWTFSGCAKLTSVTIPSSVERIRDRAFWGCSGLGAGVVICDQCVLTVNGVCQPEVVLPEGTRLIGGGAFSEQSEMLSIAIPSTVRVIDESAFYGCSGLEDVTIPEGVPELMAHVFRECSGLRSVKLPESLVLINECAFKSCRGLSHVTLPSHLTSIGSSAFNGCSELVSITIPPSVKSIGGSAFTGCPLSLVRVQRGDEDRVRELLTASGYSTGALKFVDANDPIPELSQDASTFEVRAALCDAVDATLVRNITTAASYKEYRAWAMKVGATKVKESPNAWISFAVDSAILLKRNLIDADLKIDGFTPLAMAGSFDFTVSVKDVVIGDKASEDNLKRMFELEGAESLDPVAFLSQNVAFEFKKPQEGKLKLTAEPLNKDVKSFFMKMSVK